VKRKAGKIIPPSNNSSIFAALKMDGFFEDNFFLFGAKDLFAEGSTIP